jgi:protein-arginine deiminase
MGSKVSSTAVADVGLKDDLYLFNASDDIWAKDFVEPGYSSIPGPHRPVGIRMFPAR